MEASEVRADPWATALVPIVTGTTGTTSAGYPYLNGRDFARFRDTVPHLLRAAERARVATETIATIVSRLGKDAPESETQSSVNRALKVIRSMLNTASITAPPDLWLLEQVLSTYKSLGILDRLLDGEHLCPEEFVLEIDNSPCSADGEELYTDLEFLVARGYLTLGNNRFAVSENPRARDVLSRVEARLPDEGYQSIALWGRYFRGESLDDDCARTLVKLAQISEPTHTLPGYSWIASREEIALGYRLLPVVLGLRVGGQTSALACGDEPLLPEERPEVRNAARQILTMAGTLQEGSWQPTPIGRRVFGRGPGPFGIIGAYDPYTQKLREILLQGRGAIWVQRGANVAASQDANRRTFEKANDALDAFCEASGFRYSVFIEHAVGRGEASRQRFERSGDADLIYVGADLEEAAIAAAREEQQEGRLPTDMRFITGADIGEPAAVIDFLHQHNVSSKDAVMLVGNGFHEVRNQSDARMVDIFRQYHDAGIVLLFTEESALGVEDLLNTAWNTYHAGFKYVHAKSGQGLRPGSETPPPRFGRPLPASWADCASRAGYKRVAKHSSRSRTIYPHPLSGRHNPCISVNHFFIPAGLAARLGLHTT